MRGLTDLFQWERFITPSIIRFFYWIVAAVIVLVGISHGVAASALVSVNPFLGFIGLLTCVVGVIAALIAARVAAELVLIVFRINEHLGAIRHRGEEF